MAADNWRKLGNLRKIFYLYFQLSSDESFCLIQHFPLNQDGRRDRIVCISLWCDEKVCSKCNCKSGQAVVRWAGYKWCVWSLLHFHPHFDQAPPTQNMLKEYLTIPRHQHNQSLLIKLSTLSLTFSVTTLEEYISLNPSIARADEQPSVEGLKLKVVITSNL